MQAGDEPGRHSGEPEGIRLDRGCGPPGLVPAAADRCASRPGMSSRHAEPSNLGAVNNGTAALNHGYSLTVRLMEPVCARGADEPAPQHLRAVAVHASAALLRSYRIGRWRSKARSFRSLKETVANANNIVSKTLVAETPPACGELARAPNAIALPSSPATTKAMNRVCREECRIRDMGVVILHLPRSFPGLKSAVWTIPARAS